MEDLTLADKKINLPPWMGSDDSLPSPTPGRKNNNFLSKSLRHMRLMLVEERLSEKYAAANGLLQSLDPRFKLIAALALIILAGMTHSLSVLLILWLGTVLLIKLSRLPVLKMEKHIWGIIPLIALLVSLPGMLNIVNDGTPLLVIHQFDTPVRWLGYSLPDRLFISRQGFKAGAFLFLRTGVSFSLGVLLAVTTPVADLLKSLQVLRVPQIFIMIIEMSYRYLLLLLTISIEMFEARKLRTVGDLPPDQVRAQLGSSIAALFNRSMGLTDEIYQAMTARCYTGQAVSCETVEFKRQDLLAALILAVALVSLALGGRILG